MKKTSKSGLWVKFGICGNYELGFGSFRPFHPLQIHAQYENTTNT